MLLTKMVSKNPLLTEHLSNKLRGGYYTPRKITDFLVRWAVKNPHGKILEPSCGDGNFVESLIKKFDSSLDITAIEVSVDEATKALARGGKKTKVIISDAFEWYLQKKPDAKFDSVVGNPPFIRYQNFPEEHRQKAFQLMEEEGLSPSRLTNSWLPFVVLATRALKLGGRLALVLPAELLQVSYARELRKYLSTKFKNIYILTFRRLVFSDIQQEIVLLLAERADCKISNISLLEFDDLADLDDGNFSSKKSKHRILDINHDNEKWTQFYLSHQELNLIRLIESSSAFIRLGDIAEVDVGVVTGNNEFFMLDAKKAKNLELTHHCSPIIGRSNHLSGIIFTKSDYWAISNLGEKTLLFNPGKIERKHLKEKISLYIKSGENSGVTQGYKCRIRLPHWWNVPSVWKPDAFLLRQIHEGPKIVANQSCATSTDTVHRIRIKTDIPPQSLAVAAFNSLTFALSEIRGRSYGGGVLELEPSEAENLLIPELNPKVKLPYVDVDRLIRKKKTTEALDLVDSIVLKNAGLKKQEIQTLRNIWGKLKTRRITRNHATRKKRFTHPGPSHYHH